MSTTDLRASSLRASTPVHWAHPKRDLWVATRAGEYAGMVEGTHSFDAVDGRGHFLGTFADLPAAKDALIAAR